MMISVLYKVYQAPHVLVLSNDVVYAVLLLIYSKMEAEVMSIGRRRFE